MTCQHTPKFRLNTLFAKKPKIFCSKCGAELEMTQKTHSINRAFNAILVGALFFKVLGGSAGTGWINMLKDIGVMLVYIAIYVVAYYFLIRFGQYTEKIPDPAAKPVGEQTAEMTKPAEEAGQAQAPDQSTAATSGQPGLTREQLDLMALYDSYAEKSASESHTSAKPDAASNEPVMRDQLAQPAHAADDTCDHTPVNSWKIYIPTYLNFTCAKCGKPITFNAATKKSLNVAIMAVVLLILMPSFMNNAIDAVEYAGLTLLAFVVAGLIQFLYLRKGKFEINRPETRKRR